MQGGGRSDFFTFDPFPILLAPPATYPPIHSYRSISGHSISTAAPSARRYKLSTTSRAIAPCTCIVHRAVEAEEDIEDMNGGFTTQGVTALWSRQECFGLNLRPHIVNHKGAVVDPKHNLF